MYTIYISGETDFSILYNDKDMWKECISDNFDENVVVIANREYSSIEEASWWKEAKTLISDLDNYGWDSEEFCQFDEDYSKEQIDKICNAFKKYNYDDDTKFIVEVVHIIKPAIELVIDTARGSMQSDWVEIVYVKDSINKRIFEQYFFGELVELVIVEPDENTYTDIITIDEFYDLTSIDIKKNFRARYDIPDSEELVIKKFTGYTQIANYEEI